MILKYLIMEIGQKNEQWVKEPTVKLWNAFINDHK
jgi:hypothetical protein